MNATAIIFHIRAEHKKLPKIRFSNQLYVFFLDESPFYTWEFYKVPFYTVRLQFISHNTLVYYLVDQWYFVKYILDKSFKIMRVINPLATI